MAKQLGLCVGSPFQAQQQDGISSNTAPSAALASTSPQGLAAMKCLVLSSGRQDAEVYHGCEQALGSHRAKG